MRFLRIASILLLAAPVLSGQIISKYVVFIGWGICRSDSKEVIVLRKFIEKGNENYFVLDPCTLITKVCQSDSISVSQASWDTLRSRYSTTPYIRTLKQAELNGDTLQDAGLIRFRSSQKGIDLTVDLCPSLRPLDRIVFIDLIKELGDVEKPIPLAISITGRWMNRHPGDLNWLDSLSKAGLLNIVWINHSYDHYTKRDVPLKMNFMLSQGTDINAEVLNTEIALIQKNIIPSVFFRFPGLVSDREIYNRILGFGLIPLGSDAWLAKGQWPGNGSIVLIHANGNEPYGVHEFIHLLQNKRAEAISKQWEFFDLRESLINSNQQ